MVLGGDANEIHCAIIHHFFDNTVRKMSNLHPVSHSKTVCGCARILCCVAGFLVRVAIRSAFLRSFLRNDFFCALFSHCDTSLSVIDGKQGDGEQFIRRIIRESKDFGFIKVDVSAFTGTVVVRYSVTDTLTPTLPRLFASLHRIPRRSHPSRRCLPGRAFSVL